MEFKWPWSREERVVLRSPENTAEIADSLRKGKRPVKVQWGYDCSSTIRDLETNEPIYLNTLRFQFFLKYPQIGVREDFLCVCGADNIQAWSEEGRAKIEQGWRADEFELDDAVFSDEARYLMNAGLAHGVRALEITGIVPVELRGPNNQVVIPSLWHLRGYAQKLGVEREVLERSLETHQRYNCSTERLKSCPGREDYKALE